MSKIYVTHEDVPGRRIKKSDYLKTHVVESYDHFFDIRDPQFAGGAKCDGVTDDTAAVQAAIQAAHDFRATVYVPGGITIVQPLTWMSYAAMVGEPTWGSVLRLKEGSTGALISTPDVGNCYYGYIGNLLLDGNKANVSSPDAHGVLLRGSVTFRLDRLRIIGCKGDGIRQGSTSDNKMSIGNEFIGLDVWGCDGIGLDTFNSGAADTQVITSNFGECLHGVMIPHSCFMMGVNAWKNVQHGFFGYWAENGNFSNCRAESNGYHGYVLSGCKDMNFTGCRAYKNNTEEGNYHGMWISGSDGHWSKRINILGGSYGKIEDGVEPATRDTQIYGVGCNPTYSDYLRVTDVNAFGNVTAGVNITCTNKVVADNFEG